MNLSSIAKKAGSIAAKTVSAAQEGYNSTKSGVKTAKNVTCHAPIAVKDTTLDGVSKISTLVVSAAKGAGNQARCIKEALAEGYHEAKKQDLEKSCYGSDC